MQIRENWSRLEGQVEKWTAPKAPGEPGELVVRVERVGEVKAEDGKPWPNLVKAAEGSTLRVQVPGSAAAALKIVDGATIAVDVRRGRASDLVFANADAIRLSR